MTEIVYMTQECRTTCHNESCRNNGITFDSRIDIKGDREPLVFCGACSQRITDIVNIGEPVEIN